MSIFKTELYFPAKKMSNSALKSISPKENASSEAAPISERGNPFRLSRILFTLGESLLLVAFVALLSLTGCGDSNSEESDAAASIITNSSNQSSRIVIPTREIIELEERRVEVGTFRNRLRGKVRFWIDFNRLEFSSTDWRTLETFNSCRVGQLEHVPWATFIVHAKSALGLFYIKSGNTEKKLFDYLDYIEIRNDRPNFYSFIIDVKNLRRLFENEADTELVHLYLSNKSAFTSSAHKLVIPNQGQKLDGECLSNVIENRHYPLGPNWGGIVSWLKTFGREDLLGSSSYSVPNIVINDFMDNIPSLVKMDEGEEYGEIPEIPAIETD